MSRCMCGDTECPSCGTAQGTYQPPERSVAVQEALAKRRREARARRWRKTGLSEATIRWMRDQGML